MVNISNINWLSLGASNIGKIQPTHAGNSNIRSIEKNGNTLQSRLEAIDRGDFSSLSSLRMSSNNNSGNGSSLLDRLNSIGSGELSPSYGNKEHKLDWIM